MAEAVAPWTIDAVAARFREAATTSRRLPSAKVQGYFNVWPAIVRTDYERMAKDEEPVYHFPPEPAAVDRMMETMRWVQWLEVEQRHLVWMRAERYEWQQIGRRFACDRNTAWRRWQKAIGLIASQLNAARHAAWNSRANYRTK